MYTVYRRVSISNVVARRRVDDPQYDVAVDGDQGHVDDERPIVNKCGGVEASLELVAEVVRVGRSYGIGRANHHTPAPRAPGRGREARAVGTAARRKDL